MEIVKVLSRGRIVIPKLLRDSQRIFAGDRLVVWVVSNELRLKSMPSIRPSTLKSVAGMLHRPGAKAPSERKLNQRITKRLRVEDKASRSR